MDYFILTNAQNAKIEQQSMCFFYLDPKLTWISDLDRIQSLTVDLFEKDLGLSNRGDVMLHSATDDMWFKIL